jgi:hypothetical protein
MASTYHQEGVGRSHSDSPAILEHVPDALSHGFLIGVLYCSGFQRFGWTFRRTPIYAAGGYTLPLLLAFY